MNPLETEVDILEQERADGSISEQEYQAAMRELRRDVQAMCEEAAHEAIERELDRW
jgi:hypothetical protein